jgi:hypothetical protein
LAQIVARVIQVAAAAGRADLGIVGVENAAAVQLEVQASAHLLGNELERIAEVLRDRGIGIPVTHVRALIHAVENEV